MFEGNAAKEISDRLKNVYVDSAFSYTSVKRWVRCHFESGGSSITDKPRFSRPSTAVTEENRVFVDELIQSDRRITVTEIVEKIGTGHNAAQNIISELRYSKVCARWIPRQLTDELKRSRREVCAELLERYRMEGNQFMNSIVTGDESWANHYKP